MSEIYTLLIASAHVADGCAGCSLSSDSQQTGNNYSQLARVLLMYVTDSDAAHGLHRLHSGSDWRQEQEIDT